MFTAIVILAIGQNIAVAQQTKSSNDFVTVRKSDLSPELLSKLEEKAQTQAFGDKVKQYGEWVGIGKEVGIAINEGLEAVTDNASKFSETTPGKVTIGLIIWKVAGRDLMGFLIGIPLLMWITYLFYWCWKVLYRGSFVVSGRDANGKKQYTFVEPAITKMLAEREGETVVGFSTAALLIAYFVGSWAILGCIIF
jgi:hypothetical protein